MLTGMYFSASQARQEVLNRQNSGVRERVEKWWREKGFDFPTLPDVENMAVLARQVATCRFEDVVFREMAMASGLTPTWLEYSADRFFNISNYKRSLLHPYMSSGLNKKKELISKKERLCDSTIWNGYPLRDIVTDTGISLVDHHHSLQNLVFGEVVRQDLSDLLVRMSGASGYYPFYLSLFLAHGVLFEDYHGGESGRVLSRFTEDTFEPAWRYVFEEFGLTPIIVALPWWDGMQYYPDSSDLDRYGPICDRERIHHQVRLVA